MASTEAAAEQPLRSARLIEAWQTAVSRIRPFVVAGWLWEGVLSDAERQKLGNDLVAAYNGCRGTAGMWMRLRGVSYARAVVEIGIAVNLLDPKTGRWLLREFGATSGDPETDKELAVVGGSLVLSEQPREAHWASQRIEIDWDRRTAVWAFFWELCRHAKAGQGVDWTAFGEGLALDYVAKQKSRLTSLQGFPQELADKIESSGRGAQILRWPAGAIRLFEAIPGGGVREWLP